MPQTNAHCSAEYPYRIILGLAQLHMPVLLYACFILTPEQCRTSLRVRQVFLLSLLVQVTDLVSRNALGHRNNALSVTKQL